MVQCNKVFLGPCFAKGPSIYGVIKNDHLEPHPLFEYFSAPSVIKKRQFIFKAPPSFQGDVIYGRSTTLRSDVSRARWRGSAVRSQNKKMLIPCNLIANDLSGNTES